MKRLQIQPDVLVIGDHSAAYLAAAVLRDDHKINVAHVSIPARTPSTHLTLANPALFELHPILAASQKKADALPLHGLEFLGDDAAQRSEYVGKSPSVFVLSHAPIRTALRKAAEASGVEMLKSKSLDLRRANGGALEAVIDQRVISPKVLLIADPLEPRLSQLLGFASKWDAGVMRRSSWISVKQSQVVQNSGKPLLPMSLNLKGTHCWGWLLSDGETAHASVDVAASIPSVEGIDLLKYWIEVLAKHGVLKSPKFDAAAVQSIEAPLAGALTAEHVGDRALLIGPAGGFLSACGEELYPSCWSAICAAQVVAKSLGEKHLQDSLQSYRQAWGSSLGDYLRGPQQNLKFLLPLIFRNKMMAARLAEAILFGHSVVR